MSTISLSEAFNYLDTFREFVIVNDIPAAINGKANYLAALGLSNYTEIIGGLYSGDLSGNNGLGLHYLKFIKDFFHSDYILVDNDLRNDGLKGLYSVVRCGLSHEYFIKKISKIEMDSQQLLNCGITYDPHANPQIVFYVNQYFHDFKIAFEKYYKKLKTDTSTLNDFESALRSINSSLLPVLGSSLGSQTSGGSNLTINPV
jgi:hypothetical protein